MADCGVPGSSLAVDRIPAARGSFEEATLDDGTLKLSGWLLMPDRPFAEVALVVDGRVVAVVTATTRNDLGNAFPHIAHAADTAFAFAVPWPSGGSTPRIVVVGLQNGRAVGCIGMRFFPGLVKSGGTPSPELMQRVAGHANPAFFLAEGMRSYGEFLDALTHHRRPSTIRRMLDWGCGSGRVTRYFLLDGRIPEVYGCDIDAEAIAWCRVNLPTGFFGLSPAAPPTGYPADYFDLVVAYSVFTHLAPKFQGLWLEEIQRILAPRGLLLATVHGDYATSWAMPDTVRKPGIRYRLLGWLRPHPASPVVDLPGGILDRAPDPALDGIAPEGYYRSVLQTAAYTRQAWSSYFNILDYCPQAMGTFQDLVIMQRR